MSDFVLAPAIAATTHFVADWPLCRVLLVDDARWPWLLLVPRRPGVVELTELSPEDRALLIKEVDRACRAIQAMPDVAKLNIGALGNVTPQFHLHVVGRHAGDPAWPGPVWGHGTAEPYEAGTRETRLALVREH